MRKVEHYIEISTSPQNVIDAFTELNQLTEWWGVESAYIQKQEGGIYALAWKDKQHGGLSYVNSGTVKALQPGRSLEIENLLYFHPERPIMGPTSLQIKLQKKDSKTAVYLCQDGYLKGEDWDWYFSVVSEAWPKALQSLKTYLEKG